MTIVYPGDTWTLEAKLPYVTGEVLTENSFSLLAKVGNRYALAKPSDVTMTFVAPTPSRDGSVSYTFTIASGYTKNVLHIAYLMRQLPAGFLGGYWNQTIATGNFTVKDRVTNPVVVGN